MAPSVGWTKCKVYGDSLPKQHIMPKTLVKLNNRKGTNPRGIRMIPQAIFHSTTPQPGIKASKLSENKITRATHAAIISRLNRMLVAIRAFEPNEMYARSAKVMSELSTSKHLARMPAVYDVTAAEKRRYPIPIIQPAYRMPRGKLSKPTPINTLTELKTV